MSAWCRATHERRNDCIIEADTIACGVDADGKADLKHDAAMRIHRGKIAHMGSVEAVFAKNAHLPRHGGRGCVAMPGLVNGHHHFGLTPLMMGVPFAPLELWLPQFRGMRQVGPRLDTLYSAIEMHESGTTTVHHIASGLAGNRDNWQVSTDAARVMVSELVPHLEDFNRRQGIGAHHRPYRFNLFSDR